MGLFDFFTDSFRISSPIESEILGLNEEEPRRPYSERLARREINQGTAFLTAAEELYPRTLDLMRLAAGGFGDLYRNEADKSREYELGTFERFGPRYVQAIEAADPLQARLRGAANRYVTSNFDQPLSPGIRREIEQSTRALQALRGFGVKSPANAVGELFALGERGRALEQENFLNALQLMGANQRAIGDPFLAVVGRPAQPQGSNIQSPEYGDFTNDLFSYGVNREIQGRNLNAAQGARRDALIGSTIQGLFSLAGGAGAAFCWLARAVYGEERPDWTLFRRWMLTRAPLKLLHWYWENGEAAARFVADQPALKARIRQWMDARIAEMNEPLAASA